MRSSWEVDLGRLKSKAEQRVVQDSIFEEVKGMCCKWICKKRICAWRSFVDYLYPVQMLRKCVQNQDGKRAPEERCFEVQTERCRIKRDEYMSKAWGGREYNEGYIWQGGWKMSE